jgi:hypothetical protein
MSRSPYLLDLFNEVPAIGSVCSRDHGLYTNRSFDPCFSLLKLVGQFEELYQALQIPREDINAAW